MSAPLDKSAPGMVKVTLWMHETDVAAVTLGAARSKITKTAYIRRAVSTLSWLEAQIDSGHNLLLQSDDGHYRLLREQR